MRFPREMYSENIINHERHEKKISFVISFKSILRNKVADFSVCIMQVKKSVPDKFGLT